MPRADDPASKPADLGNGSLAASFGSRSAALLAVLTPHARHGVVELSGQPAFDEAQRGDAEATRAYRRAMTDDDAWCLRLETETGSPLSVDDVDLSRTDAPRWVGHLAGEPVEAVASVGGEAIILAWRPLGGAPAPDARLRLRGRLDRPALAEITEINPPPPTGATTVLGANGSRLRVAAPAIGASLTLDAAAGAWSVRGGEAVLPLPRADPWSVAIRVEERDSRAPSPVAAATLPGVAGEMATIVERALAYVRGCTALRVAPDERAILTDHRVLPLSWTRDAYYQALLLLATDADDDRRRVADHLRWLWRRCERPQGRWVRSHHANGRPKDRAFQADQQLYPILELADYWRTTGEVPAGVDWPASLDGAWRAALAEVDPATGLIASVENAADDPADAPFLAGSQILLWYAARRLEELAAAGVAGSTPVPFRACADSVRAAFGRHVAGAEGWAYAVDGVGQRVAYHDGNDLPVALAPLWGFCSPDDRGWRATMAFAFSAVNPAFFDGPRAGLGSVHTPLPWTLGDVQAWLVGYVVNDAAAQRRALARLTQVAFGDGMLPEAYTAAGPLVRIRHWFAWPGAALGALLLLAERGTLEDRLGTTRRTERGP